VSEQSWDGDPWASRGSVGYKPTTTDSPRRAQTTISAREPYPACSHASHGSAPRIRRYDHRDDQPEVNAH